MKTIIGFAVLGILISSSATAQSNKNRDRAVQVGSAAGTVAGTIVGAASRNPRVPVVAGAAGGYAGGEAGGALYDAAHGCRHPTYPQGTRGTVANSTPAVMVCK